MIIILREAETISLTGFSSVGSKIDGFDAEVWLMQQLMKIKELKHQNGEKTNSKLGSEC